MRRLPDTRAILAALEPPKLSLNGDVRLEGRLFEIGPTLLRAHLPGVKIGELCTLPNGGLSEVVGLNGTTAMLSPYQEPSNMTCGMMVRPNGTRADVAVGPSLLGRVLDALGRPMDGLPPMQTALRREIDVVPADPMERKTICNVLPVGVRAIDTALTIGAGQRIGIFAPAGCGKSTLLGMLSSGCEADVIVLALVGERGREVREFLENMMNETTRARCVVVVATSDRPALERVKAPAVATTIAEYFRDQGRHVLLLVDSLTRYARAVREIALATGEPIVGGGYPPSLYARLPRLLERAGPAARGNITAFYTVLMEQQIDPLAEEVRSLLDGHIVLSRKLAEANHFPAIDVLASVSRVMLQVTTEQHRRAAARLRQLLAAWHEVELLVRVGEYQHGQDPDADDALARRSQIEALLRQPVDELCAFQKALMLLTETVGLPC
ncbi:FliI/YscN family ATPase [Caballeronia sp. EK]|uniref:FliI/YscN family ATPase n=1 Tax=Caballeronia sp. EK TaxID=2767469 RepID=UPI00165519D7|nr:FliI/YscN family ATPase [Caballeronia sp. EK]MBC8642785.1 FliI/YscN family ATPase [Caballeronia sp. EK]